MRDHCFDNSITAFYLSVRVKTQDAFFDPNKAIQVI